MVYLFTAIGLIFGFSVGLGTINVILRHKTKEEIQTDKSIRTKFGLLVWSFAAVGGWTGHYIFQHYFY